MVTLGERVRIARELKGMSQQQLGELIGYPSYTAQFVVWKIEHDVNLPQTASLRPLCKALGLTLDALIPEDLDRTWYKKG